MINILQKENELLRQISKEVSSKDLPSPKINKILKDMSLALKSQRDGVAIAAPQIGVSLRIFIVAGKIISPDSPNLVFINPQIIKTSRKSKDLHEGCLSVRWLYGWVNRSDKVTVEALDKSGAKFQYGGSGVLAQVFQHEIDHLNGILFTDKAENLEEMKPKDEGK